MKMDIRVAEVLSAKRVPKTDMLMELQLSLGAETRTVVSGIAEHFTAEEVVGRKVSYLANLAPRKLRGVLSSGMILMAEDQAGKLSFVDPGTDTESGSIIR
jgi:methionyl-tRNA synthetase